MADDFRIVMGHIPPLLHLAGLLFEVYGVFLMSTRYIDAAPGEVPLALITALWRGSAAADAAFGAEHFTDERGRALSALQGLSFIGLGFLLQILSIIFGLVNGDGSL